MKNPRWKELGHAAEEHVASPPRLLTTLLDYACPAEWRDGVLGDLDERFRRKAEAGRLRAEAWYLWQVATSISPLLRVKLRPPSIVGIFLRSRVAIPRVVSPTVDSVLYCEVPVATPFHRLVAAALDCAMVLMAYGGLLGVFQALGGQFPLNKTTVAAFSGVLLVTAFTYGMIWALAGCETAGMHWTKLRLTTFDGLPLEPRQRVLRLFGSCLSACTVLGLLWSLADEESLTWQDHISRTFPTPSPAAEK